MILRRRDESDGLITLKELFAMVTKLTGQQEVFLQLAKDSDAIHQDHEARLRSLERWRYAMPASVVVALASVAIVVLPHLLH